MMRALAVVVCFALVGASCKREGATSPPVADQDSSADVKKVDRGGNDVKVVRVRRGGEAPPRSEPPPPQPRADRPPPHRPPPRVNPSRPDPIQRDDRSGVVVACSFDKGFVSVMPKSMFDPGEEFLMQALIGFTEQPSFWRGIKEFKKFEPFRAVPCNAGGITFPLKPGKYKILVGQAGQFSVRGEYRDNGFIRDVTVSGNAQHEFTVRKKDLRHTWLCISCPYLVVFRDGRAVDVGQVLIDRYTRRRYGTDVVRTSADVKDGVLTLRLEEREPEVSFVDAVVVHIGKKKLRPRWRTPRAIRAVDDRATPLRLGESAELEFWARGFEDGPVEVEIAVSGHYEPIGPLL